jgi:hypothetical protein
MLPTTAAPLSSPSAPTFQPIEIEAEAPGNVITGGAKAIACVPCSGGYRVGYIDTVSTLVVRATLPSAGTRTVSVIYESDGPRLLKVSANGAQVDQRWVTGTGWEVPQTFQFVAELPAGDVPLTFYDDVSPAPDVDAVIVS